MVVTGCYEGCEERRDAESMVNRYRDVVAQEEYLQTWIV